MNEVPIDETKSETSFESSLKQILKQSDYKKLESIIIKFAQDEKINIKEIMELTKKSRTIAWRYVQILVDCGFVAAAGNTNNSRHKNANNTVYKRNTEEKRR